MSTTDYNNSQASATQEKSSLSLDACPPGTPTEANSPDQEEPQSSLTYNLRPRNDKLKTATWKVKEAGSWKEILRLAGRASRRGQGTERRLRVGRRVGSKMDFRDAASGTDHSQGSKPLPGCRLKVEDFHQTFYGHRPDGSPEFRQRPRG
ncbi:uncharacterized protein FPOAC1_012979 [Fusarium poae]|uniref:uncharacterized protein n=1 Tax=Fusarium poae TaxID=36050 RepID=UPI001D03EC39|nr:uncharacterized protein FPOAC1_012979 [Fusarium poae]KAG8665001.1 hypothetical protein FPOAC1_012979 [Fusarium poae]